MKNKKIILILTLFISIFGNIFSQNYFDQKISDAYSASDILDLYNQSPYEFTDYLLSINFDYNKIYSDNTFLLEVCAKNKSAGAVNLMKFAIEHGANIDLYIPGRDYKNTALFYAIDNNCIENAIYLIDAGANFKLTNHYNMTHFHYAVYRNHPSVVAKMLEKKDASKCINVMDNSKYTPLIQAVSSNQYDIAKLLLENGANPNLCDKNSITALYAACDNNNLKMVKLLLDHKADPNLVKKDYYYIPLYAALSRKNFEMVEMLVNNGANVNLKNAPLTKAAEINDTKFLKYLLSKGADINGVNPNGDSVVLNAVSSGNAQVLLILKDYKTNWKQIDKNGRNLIHYYILSDYFMNYMDGEEPFMAETGMEFIQFLVSQGVDINLQDKKNGLTPLHLLCISEYSPYEFYGAQLLEYGADPNKKGKDGCTPLSLSIFHPKLVKLLLDNGADPSVKYNGLTPMEIAQKTLALFQSDELKATISLLSNANPESKESISLPEAILIGDVALAKKLLSETKDINTPDSQGRYAINAAVRSQNIELLKLVLAKKPDLSKPDKGYLFPPLLNAVYLRNAQIVKLLLQSGADANQQTYNSLYHYYDSPLTNAMGNIKLGNNSVPNLEIVKILIDGGADINKGTYRDKQTPLMYALENSNTEVTKYLISKGASLYILDDSRNSVYDYVQYATSDTKDAKIKLLDKALDQDFLGKTKKASSNLNIRKDQDISSKKVFTLKSGSSVKITKVGHLENIDGITSVWVEIETMNGAKDSSGNNLAPGSKGWCFAGYLD